MRIIEKKIKDLEAAIESLKNENEMLVEMMETNKRDYEERLKNK